jgi:5-methylcytosine-specific restriction protein B
MTTTANAIRKTWVFQANPNLYSIETSLRLESEEFWNLRQHAKAIKVGDRVLIWISGPEAGIYAVGTVITAPITMSDSEKGQEYWLDKTKGRQLAPRVRVRYDQKLIDRPLKKDYLEWDPDLANLSIICFPRGTNFPVTEAEWLAIKKWLDSAV